MRQQLRPSCSMGSCFTSFLSLLVRLIGYRNLRMRQEPQPLAVDGPSACNGKSIAEESDIRRIEAIRSVSLRHVQPRKR